jgi:hypothetical protein
MELREHFLVSLDHGVEHGYSKLLEVLPIRLHDWPHFPERFVPFLFGEHGDALAQLGDAQGTVHVLHGTVGVIEQWLGVGPHRVGDCSHTRLLPSWPAASSSEVGEGRMLRTRQSQSSVIPAISLEQYFHSSRILISHCSVVYSNLDVESATSRAVNSSHWGSRPRQ